MTFPAATDTVPLKRWDDGTIRIAGSRVRLEYIVDLWLQGESPEGIRESFPSLDLSEVYGAVAYFLRHRQEVDAYMEEQFRLQDEAEVEFRRRYPQDRLKERLLRRTAPAPER